MNRQFPTLTPPILELNITDLCNLTCDFCPRAHGYPNQNIHMTMEMLDLILESHLDFYNKQNYRIPIWVIGRGEPTLHDRWVEVIDAIADYNKSNYDIDWGIDTIHTNGYKWEKWIPDYGSKIRTIHLNCYSNKTYIEYLKLKEKFDGTNVNVYNRGAVGNNEGTEDYRDLNGKKTVVRYNNRAGSIPQDIIPMKDITETKNIMCSKPWETLYLDFDGEWRLCCNDWDDLISLGNIKDYGMHDHMWKNPKYIEYKWRLANGDRKLTPCNKCNAVPHPDLLSGYLERVETLKNWQPGWLRSVMKTLPYN